MPRGWCWILKATQSLAELRVSAASCLSLIRRRLTKGRIAWVDPRAKETCWAARLRLLRVDSQSHESVYDDEWCMWNPPAAIQPPSALWGDGVVVSLPAQQSCDSRSEHRPGCTELTRSLNNWVQITSNERKSPTNSESKTGGYIRHYQHNKI